MSSRTGAHLPIKTLESARQVEMSLRPGLKTLGLIPYVYVVLKNLVGREPQQLIRASCPVFFSRKNWSSLAVVI